MILDLYPKIDRDLIIAFDQDHVKAHGLYEAVMIAFLSHHVLKARRESKVRFIDGRIWIPIPAKLIAPFLGLSLEKANHLLHDMVYKNIFVSRRDLQGKSVIPPTCYAFLDESRFINKGVSK